MEFTDEQKQQLLDLVAKWQERMKLGHYKIEVDWEEEPEGGRDRCMLQVEGNTYSHSAKITVGQFFADRFSDAERENAVCHEMVHIHFAPVETALDPVMEELGPQARRLHERTIEERMEQAVDGIANAFVPVDD